MTLYVFAFNPKEWHVTWILSWFSDGKDKQGGFFKLWIRQLNKALWRGVSVYHNINWKLLLFCFRARKNRDSYRSSFFKGQTLNKWPNCFIHTHMWELFNSVVVGVCKDIQHTTWTGPIILESHFLWWLS